ncbi:hypothetical protein [Streptomyces venezuelae]|uniref:hypothetical protein n=1 Tax=Streptomyces venezuelae TaxID=54571 RepID=UPI0012391EB3|nr:hypothetical protein [Streptomyces venezuelae]
MKERYEKQRDKLTTDLAKLEDRREKFVTLLGNVRIKRYMFMVPYFDSHELVQHASTKAAEYRGKSLPHLDPGFQIVVVDEDAYADIREQVLLNPQPLVEVHEQTQEDVAAWIRENSHSFTTAERKLQGLIQDDPRRLQAVESLVMQYIKGENALADMRRKFPDNWERATRYRNHKEQLLIFEYPSTDIQFSSLSKIAKEIEHELKEDAPALDNRLRSAIAWASIADWIMRCPLDFPTVAS